jgi:hypothetical protein
MLGRDPKLSMMYAGEIVEVRSEAEILRTLDSSGCLEGLPFMPEMLQYCGRRFGVAKRAHKTCDFVTARGARRLSNSVLLENLRCDGKAHGGCEAQCSIFWKVAWLKPVASTPDVTNEEQTTTAHDRAECNVAQLTRASVSHHPGQTEPTYRCQATTIPEFTQPMSAWDIRQYIEDVTSGNVESVWTMIPRFIYRAYDNLINLGIGWGPVLRWLYNVFQRIRGGRPYPARSGRIPAGSRTPSGELGLQPGELVRVKSYEDIVETLDTAAKNRGMAFSAEMAPYCGKTMRVRARVTKLIDERTGQMLHTKSPCIILEGSVCLAMYNKSMLFCPRATYSYWREIWLDRIEEAPSTSHS